MNNENYLAVAKQAALAGAQVLKDWTGRFTVSEKSKANLVTEADKESQQAIYEIILRNFPTHGFLGEEGVDEKSTQGHYLWIVDPLDGTTNYVHGFPYYAVSIALEIDSRLVVGVIYDLNRDEMFTAIRGAGAFCNDQPIHVSRPCPLSETLLITSIPTAADADDPALKRFVKLVCTAQSVQRTGSAALNLAYLAYGRIDGFWSSNLHSWDMAAGALLVEEAGGVLSNFQGDEFNVHQPAIVCSNSSSLHESLLKALEI